MKDYLKLLFTVLALLLMRANPAWAFQLRPISQVLAPSGARATHTYDVINTQQKRIAVEMTVVRRQMNLDGEETLQPAEDDFLIYPSQMILNPGETQSVRVSWIGDPQPQQELAFRLLAEQLPINLVDPTQPVSVRPVGQVEVVLRYVGSLFVRPANARPAVHIESVVPHTNAQGTPHVAITFANRGDASAQLRNLRLGLTAQGQTVTLLPEQLEGISGTTVLPGHSRRYLLPWPVTLPQGPLTATFDYRQD